MVHNFVEFLKLSYGSFDLEQQIIVHVIYMGFKTKMRHNNWLFVFEVKISRKELSLSLVHISVLNSIEIDSNISRQSNYLSNQAQRNDKNSINSNSRV